MNDRTVRQCAVPALLAVVAIGRTLPAQSAAPRAAVATPVTVARAGTVDSVKGGAPLFTMHDYVLGAGFVVATVAMFPLDKRIARHLQNPGAQANRFFDRSATGFEVIASPGAFVIGGGMYLAGRLGHHERLLDLGWHGTEAVLVADVVTGMLKGSAGRSRPFVTADTNPHDFRFGRGFASDDRTSFPSGHATTAFAAAAAVTAETGRWWPRSTWFVGPVMYGGATLVGLSRMYHNKHWASDVALGAAIGTFSGQKVVQYSHAHPDNPIDRVLLHAAIAPDGHGGMTVGWSMSTR